MIKTVCSTRNSPKEGQEWCHSCTGFDAEFAGRALSCQLYSVEEMMPENVGSTGNNITE